MNITRVTVWAVLYAALAVQTWRYIGETIYYGEYLHWTGVWATRLLILTLAITPLRLLWPLDPVLRFLMLHRRDLGVATFGYSAAHALAYLAREADFRIIVDEALGMDLMTGWIAGLIFLVLALTSNDVSVRTLGKRWKRLHTAVYAAAILTLMHWVLTAFDPTAGYVHAGVLAALFGLRWWLLRKSRRRPTIPGR